MNKIQTQAVEMLRREILKHDGLQQVSDDYEYKRFEINEDNDVGLVFVSTLVWLRDSDKDHWGTHRHICIGRRGGLTLLNPRNKDRHGHKIQGYKVVYWTTR